MLPVTNIRLLEKDKKNLTVKDNSDTYIKSLIISLQSANKTKQLK